MNQNQYDNTRLALEVMTAWASDPDGVSDFVTQRLRATIEQRDVDAFEGALQLVFGFINLSGHLLIQREADTGVMDTETLRQLALEIAAQNPEQS